LSSGGPPARRRVPLMAGNWKMYKTSGEGADFVRQLAGELGVADDREVVVAPPFTGLASAVAAARGSSVKVAAQDVFWQAEGAFTGEIAPGMLTDLGVYAVIIGHSERRQFFGETDGIVARKVRAALDNGLLPIVCVGETEAEREAAQSESAFRPYWDLHRLTAYARPVYPRLLRSWDGGAVPVAGTLAEGDEVAGFSVIELPGHAPGLIGLWRASDRLALVSDCIYTIDPQTGRKQPAGVPHAAFNQDTELARASIRKLAALGPSAVWAGHADPVTGDVAGALARAAEV